VPRGASDCGGAFPHRQFNGPELVDGARLLARQRYGSRTILVSASQLSPFVPPQGFNPAQSICPLRQCVPRK
jgi:hypothetical protein